MKVARSILILLTFFSLASCQNDYNDIFQKRSNYALSNPTEIVLAVIVPNEEQQFAKNYIKGIELAVNELNENKSLSAGKTFSLKPVENKGSFELLESDLVKIINTPQIVAVLGHAASSNAIPASIMYGKAGLIFIPSFATNAVLSGTGRPEHVFKMLPDNSTQIDQIINFTKLQGSKEIALLSSQDTYNKDLSILFASRAEDQNLLIAEEVFFSENEMAFNHYVEKLKKAQFDSIVISSSTSQAISLVREIRRSGIYSPVILTDSVDKDVFSAGIDKDIHDIITVSSYNIDVDSVNNKKFIASYNKSYNSNPDDAAVIGYDSVMLLAHAIKKAGATHVKSISSTLHNMPAWPGIKSIYKFDEFGNVRGKKYHFEVLVDNNWYKIPYSEKSYNNYLLNESMGFENNTFIDEEKYSSWSDSKESYNYELLRLSKRIFKFDSLGVTYIDDEDGKTISQFKNIEKLAGDLGFELVSCKVPSFLRKNINLLKDFISVCYQEISLSAEAVFFSPSRILPVSFYEPIIEMLDKENIPVFSIDTRAEIKPLTVISLNRGEIILNDFESEKILPKILSKSTIHDFYNYVKHVPEVSVNFEKYKKYNLNENIILDLSPVKPIKTMNDS